MLLNLLEVGPCELSEFGLPMIRSCYHLIWIHVNQLIVWFVHFSPLPPPPPQTTYIILINLGRRNHEQTKEHSELLQAPDWVYYV